jgi:acetyl-CoA C-acetyltransferase
MSGTNSKKVNNKLNGGEPLDVAVLGVGMTRFGELWDESLVSLACQAGREAIRDANLQAKDIDALVVGNMLASGIDNQAHLGALISSELKLKAPAVRVEGACASGGLAIRTGIEKLLAGTARKVLVVGVEKMTDQTTDYSTLALMGASCQAEQLSGLTFPGLYAMVTRAYMEKYGICDRDIAPIPVKNHMHGSMNPKAHLRFSINEEQVLRSPCVASPVKLLDCSPLSDGAAAVVLALPNGVRNGVVHIIGSGQGSDELGLAERKSLTSFSATKQAVRQAFRQASIETVDVDFMEVHDCFTIGEVLAIEDMGFTKQGEGWAVAANGECRLGGKRPVNTSGGLKSCGHPVAATGVKQIVELTLQLRGAAQNRQVEGAQVGVAHNVGGVGGTAVVHVLRK